MIEKKPAKSILLALTLVAVITLSAFLLHAQTNPNDQVTQQSEGQSESSASRGSFRELQSQRLEGSWEVTGDAVVPPGVPQPPSFHAYETFTRGGALIGSDRQRPASKQHGTWAHLGGNKYAWTFKEDFFDAMGNFDGVLTLRFRATLTGRDEFVGVANSELRNANGDLIRNRCATGKGRRIMLEPLSEQCQGITPPR
jgi:hypothetical protein